MRYPMRSFPSDLAMQAGATHALDALTEAVETAPANGGGAHRRTPRAAHRAHAHAPRATGQGFRRGRDHLAGISVARHRRSGGRGRHHLQRISAAAPITARARSRAPFSRSPPAGGLGWGFGAALGAKLAAPDAFVVATLGDGAYMFANPMVGHWVSATHNLPILTIVFNNSRYGAVRSATLSMFKDGVAGENDGRMLADLDPAPALRCDGQGARRSCRARGKSGRPARCARARAAMPWSTSGGRRCSTSSARTEANAAKLHQRRLRHAASRDRPDRRRLDPRYSRPDADRAVHRANSGGRARTFARAHLPDVPAQPRADRRGSLAAKVLDKARPPPVGSIDFVLAAAALISLLLCRHPLSGPIVELVTRPWYGVLVATVIVLLVFEASRRVTGLSLVLIVLALCAARAVRLPAAGDLRQPAGRAQPADRLSRHRHQRAARQHRCISPCVVVVPFIIMGQVLSRCGGSDFFADLAAALMGRFRGGAAKIAVVGSAFFGMISGSAVANVASVGTITIPLMKRAGFPGAFAAADRGGRLDRRPDRAAGDGRGRLPDGGISAGALFARDGRRDHSGRSCIYAALFIQVDLESAKLGILGAPRASLPSLGAVLREGWHFLDPVRRAGRRTASGSTGSRNTRRCAPPPCSASLAMIVPHKGRRHDAGEVLDAPSSAPAARSSTSSPSPRSPAS